MILRDADPAHLLTLIEQERITEAFAVPAVLMVLLATPTLSSTDLSSLRHIYYGASPISEDVLVRCISALSAIGVDSPVRSSSSAPRLKMVI